MPLTINQERILRAHKQGEKPPPATEVAKYVALARNVARLLHAEQNGKGTTLIKRTIQLLLDDLGVKAE